MKPLIEFYFIQSEERRDNRDLCGDQSNQKMTKADIQELKKQGVSGQVRCPICLVFNANQRFLFFFKFLQEIIEQLVENSATFKKKNTFSQEKYLKKKRKK